MTFVPAKRGFIAITEKTRMSYALHTGAYHTCSVDVGLVSSVTRDGKVKRVDTLSNSAPKTPRDWDNITILDPAKLANADAFLAECRERQSTAPGKQYNPFADLNDVRETARKYLA